MKPVSVTCRTDNYLHLASEEPRLGTSVFTLCLERWKKREPCRTDSRFCPKCLARFQELQSQRKENKSAKGPDRNSATGS